MSCEDSGEWGLYPKVKMRKVAQYYQPVGCLHRDTLQ